MHYFTIKDIENLSGIKAHTWRIWEQRYNLCLPQRKESNHRFYDNANLKQILRISYLYHSGLKISKIAHFTDEQLLQETIDRSATVPAFDFYIKELLEASIDFDHIKFEEITDDVFKNFGAEKAIAEVVYPYMDKIGMLWLTDHIIPAQEHFSSNIIRQKLVNAIDMLPRVKHSAGNYTVLFTPEKEHHELPLLFISYLMQKANRQVLYMGSDIAINKLKELAAVKPFQCLHFHLITNLTSKNAQQYVEMLADEFPKQTIYMSGTHIQHVDAAPANVHLFKSLPEMINFIKLPQYASHQMET